MTGCDARGEGNDGSYAAFANRVDAMQLNQRVVGVMVL